MGLTDYVTICSNENCNMQCLYSHDTPDKYKESECALCHSKMTHTNITAEEMFLIQRTSKDRDFLNAMIKLKKNDIIEYQTKISQFRSQAKADGCYDKPKPKVCCPKCGSTQIQIVPRKFSFLTGFATNKTDRVCANCMYRW